MEKELKSQNKLPLTFVYFGTFLLVATVQWGVEEVFEFSQQFGEQMLIVGVFTTFVGVLSNALPNTAKHTLVYWRFRNVLSGHRCRKICTKDSRMQLNTLQERWPEVFLHEMNAKNQNAYWYEEIYLSVKDAPEVLQAHRSFLLYRDATTGLFLLLVGTLLWNLFGKVVPISPVSIWSAAVLLMVTLLVSLAARNSGNRMVANAAAVALRA